MTPRSQNMINLEQSDRDCERERLSQKRRSTTGLLEENLPIPVLEATTSPPSWSDWMPSVRLWHRIRPRVRYRWRITKVDVQAVRWKVFCWRLYVYLSPIIGLLLLLAAFIAVALSSLMTYTGACLPDGNFNIGLVEYNPWTTDGLFQITLGFGHLSFTVAKLVDVVWDVIVGRGGQALLGIISYMVYTKSLVRSMENAPVTYATFEAITLEKAASVSAVFKLMRDSMKRGDRRSKVSMLWLITSTSFILAFPTLFSAMSGYSPNLQAFIRTSDGNLVQFSDFQLVRYVIHDGARLGHGIKNDYLVTVDSSNNGRGDPVLSSFVDSLDGCGDTGPEDASGWTDFMVYKPECMLMWHISHYTSIYGLMGLANVSSTFNFSGEMVELTAPVLNISIYAFGADNDDYKDNLWNMFPFGQTWIAPGTEKPIFNATSGTAYAYGDEIYLLDYMENQGICQAMQSSYKWGFSYLPLFIVLLLWNIWALGTYVLWLDAYLNSRLDRTKRRMGMRRALLDEASAMRKVLGSDAVESLSNDALNNIVKRELDGGRISYDMTKHEMLPLSRLTEIRLWWRQLDKKRWVREEKWWLALCGVLLGLTADFAGQPVLIASDFDNTPIPQSPAKPIFLVLLPLLGVITIIAVGRQARSRWLLFAVPGVVGLLLVPVGPFAVTWGVGYTWMWWRQLSYYSGAPDYN